MIILLLIHYLFQVDSDSRVVAPLPPAGKTALGAHTALLTANAGSGYASYM
jgi:hypothetical protein